MPSHPTHPTRRLPDPEAATTPEEMLAGLRRLRDDRGLSLTAVLTKIRALRRARGQSPPSRTTVQRYLSDKQAPKKRYDSEVVRDLAAVLIADDSRTARWHARWEVLCGDDAAANRVDVLTSLPDPVPGLLGRDELINSTLQALTDSAAVRGVALIGLPGIGKTSTAINLAHALAERTRFDVTLFVDLRGIGSQSSSPPAALAAVLEKFLTTLGVATTRLPPTITDRAALFRKHCRTRRLLVVLDNAADREQIRHLLPDGPGCVALITSRRRLAAPHGAAAVRQIELDALTEADAVALLRAARPAAVDADPQAAALIVALLHRLPLAVSAAARQLARETTWSLDDHLYRLAAALLGEIDGASETTREAIVRRLAAQDRPGGVVGLDDAVTTQLALSYDTLTPQAQQLLCLLSHYPGHDLDVPSAAALTGTDGATARSTVSELAEALFLQHRSAGRYAVHDLVAAFARRRARDEVPHAACIQAVSRTLRYFLESAQRAVAVLHPTQRHPTLSGDTDRDAGTPARALSRRTASAWLVTQLPNLTVAAAYAASDPDLSCRAHDIALALEPYLRVEARHHDAARLHDSAVRASASCSHTDARADVLDARGRVHRQLGDADHARVLHRQALDIRRALGDVAGEARTLNKLGLAYRVQGRLAEAAAAYQQAADVLVGQPDNRELLLILGNLGVVRDLQGELDAALACYQHLIAIGNRAGDDIVVAKALCDTATIHKRRGRHSTAIGCYEQAAAMFHEHRDVSSEAICIENIGSAHTLAGRPTTALPLLATALKMRIASGERGMLSNTHYEIGLAHLALGDAELASTHLNTAYDIAAHDRLGTALCRAANALGDLLGHQGQRVAATARYREALDEAVSCANPDEQAHAHVGLASTDDSNEDNAREQHLRQALQIYQRMNVPEQVVIAGLLQEQLSIEPSSGR